jgi:hypothetical protein
VAERGLAGLKHQRAGSARIDVASANRRQDMENLITAPVLGALSEYFTWWQGVLVILLVVLIVVYMKIKNKQT